MAVCAGSASQQRLWLDKCSEGRGQIVFFAVSLYYHYRNAIITLNFKSINEKNAGCKKSFFVYFKRRPRCWAQIVQCFLIKMVMFNSCVRQRPINDSKPVPIVDKAIKVDVENASRFLARLTAASSLPECQAFSKKLSIHQNSQMPPPQLDKLRISSI